MRASSVCYVLTAGSIKLNRGVPPGARFDPYGPPDVPDFDPTRFMRNPPRRPGGGGGIHPDLQHFPGGPDFI
ncbi:hypothetical protein CRG98_023696 [Punica granatum]|uniref:PI31 proteasome regulator N-terminal domain-containing protein n=1 Tax=Punica granatum TaxID=22663 RepID=A0A2I0JI26_PUNGR|nr:hypothetical protein CRG98_023696 [Punica granatum]